MANGLRSLRWRAALAVVTLASVGAWVWLSGRAAHLLQIDFTWAGTYLEGARVEVDGEVVGTLERYGNSTFVTGFEVEPGEHVVRVLRDGCEGTPEAFVIGGSSGRRVTFMADVDDGFRCRVILR